MENSERAKIVIGLCQKNLQEADRNYVRAERDLASAKKGDELRKQSERLGDSKFDRDPYNVQMLSEMVQDTLAMKVVAQEVLDYAIDTFLSRI